MSELTRRSATDHADYAYCVTCNKYDHWKNFHAGHFIHISKQHPLSYDRRNINVQCEGCNFFKHKGIEYTLWMINKYGQSVVDELMEMKKLPYCRRSEMESVVTNIQAQLLDLNTSYTQVPF